MEELFDIRNHRVKENTDNIYINTRIKVRFGSVVNTYLYDDLKRVTKNIRL